MCFEKSLCLFVNKVSTLVRWQELWYFLFEKFADACVA